MVQKTAPPGGDLWELTREVQQLVSERKTIGKRKAYGYHKVKGLWFGSSDKPGLPEKPKTPLTDLCT